MGKDSAPSYLFDAFGYPKNCRVPDDSLGFASGEIKQYFRFVVFHSDTQGDPGTHQIWVASDAQRLCVMGIGNNVFLHLADIDDLGTVGRRSVAGGDRLEHSVAHFGTDHLFQLLGNGGRVYHVNRKFFGAEVCIKCEEFAE